MGNLPPMVLGNGYSGAKVGDLPPMVSGGDIAVSFFAGFMTQWWLDMGVLGESRDDCEAALSDVKGWKMAISEPGVPWI